MDENGEETMVFKWLFYMFLAPQSLLDIKEIVCCLQPFHYERSAGDIRHHGSLQDLRPRFRMFREMSSLVRWEPFCCQLFLVKHPGF